MNRSKGQKVQEEPIQTLSNITIPNEEVKSVIDKVSIKFEYN